MVLCSCTNSVANDFFFKLSYLRRYRPLLQSHPLHCTIFKTTSQWYKFFFIYLYFFVFRYSYSKVSLHLFSVIFIYLGDKKSAIAYFSCSLYWIINEGGRAFMRFRREKGCGVGKRMERIKRIYIIVGKRGENIV